VKGLSERLQSTFAGIHVWGCRAMSPNFIVKPEFAMRCQACGEWPATRYIAFYQNIGALVVRFSKSIRGNLCSHCIHKYFWDFTAINLVLGWWGVISFCVIPFFILNNLLYYVGLLGVKSRHGKYGDAETESVPPTNRVADDQGECYLCGKPLEPEERQARVCRACRL
jgi:hypothetical protein